MNNFLAGFLRILMATVVLTGGCSLLGDRVVLDGAVADLVSNRVHIAATRPARVEAGEPVTIYQRVEQKAIDPGDRPWHPLKPVATGTVAEITPEGAWVTIESGSVVPKGEIQLRQER